MNTENYSGKYFRTSWGDIKGSKGWFGKICLLGLISFIPVFGQMTTYGYSFEWAHKAAWGLDNPMPKKIYGREGSKMLRWGWFALVIVFVFSLVPGIVSSIGSALSSAGAGEGFYTATGRYLTVTQGNPLLAGLGWLFGVAALVLFVFACLFAWTGIMRMTMYDRLGTGFQIGKIWEMIRRDFGGLMRILGMAILFGAIGGIIVSVIVFGVTIAVIGAAVAPMAIMYSGGIYYDDALLLYIFGLLVTLLPFFLIIGYISLVYGTFVELLVARALGYWTRQFNVAEWGSKDDPLPDAPAPQAGAQPQPPVAGAGAEQPAPPTGEPVVVDEVVETTVVDAEGEVVAEEVDEVEVTVEDEDGSEE